MRGGRGGTRTRTFIAAIRAADSADVASSATNCSTVVAKWDHFATRASRSAGLHTGSWCKAKTSVGPTVSQKPFTSAAPCAHVVLACSCSVTVVRFSLVSFMKTDSSDALEMPHSEARASSPARALKKAGMARMGPFLRGTSTRSCEAVSVEMIPPGIVAVTRALSLETDEGEAAFREIS